MEVNCNTESISICFCAWNEQENILTCVDDAVKFAEEAFPNNYEIYVIDNASTDKTPHLVHQQNQFNPRVKLYRHEENRLYSGSYKSAFSISKGRYIAVLDGDYQHTCADLPKALSLIQNSNVDVVFGWKQERRDGIMRDIFSLGLRLVSRLLIGHRLNDINCGFRVLKNSAAKQIIINEKVNSVGPEIYCESRRLNFVVGEIVVQHFARQAGAGVHSSVGLLMKGTMKFFKYLRRLRKRYGSCPILSVARS